ncbi:non-histone chromosomal protein HMG-like [Pholidichthys leucotaenia]
MPKRSSKEATNDADQPKRRSERIKCKPQKPEPKPKKGPAKPKKSKVVEKGKPEEKCPDAPTENGEAKANDEAPAADEAEQKAE